MNFDKALRASMPSAEEPPGLSRAISNQLAERRRRRAIVRTIVLSFGVTAAAIGAFTFYPTISAEAALTRMKGALDAQDKVVATRYNVDSEGRRHLAGIMAYDSGKWRIGGRTKADYGLFIDGKRYTYEPFTKSYIVEAADGPFAHGSGIGLSSTLSQATAWGSSVELSDMTYEGKPARRAVVTSGQLPERFTIIADPKTDLPLAGFGESRIRNGWLQITEVRFRYGQSIDPALFYPEAGVPQFSKDQWKAEVVRRMTSQTLATHPLGKGQLKIRALEVAGDGTVFIAYQSSSTGESWKGNAFTVQDDLGTTYAMRQTFGGSELPEGSALPDGKIEVEVLVPAIPIPPQRPRTLTLKAVVDKEEGLLRMVPTLTQRPDGTTEETWGPNYHRVNADPSEEDGRATINVLSRRFTSPTCEARPGFMTIVNYGDWINEMTSELAKAATRADHYRKDPERRAYWLREQLRIIEMIEAQGGGPYSRAGIGDELEKVEQALRQR